MIDRVGSYKCRIESCFSESTRDSIHMSKINMKMILTSSTMPWPCEHQQGTCSTLSPASLWRMSSCSLCFRTQTCLFYAHTPAEACRDKCPYIHRADDIAQIGVLLCDEGIYGCSCESTSLRTANKDYIISTHERRKDIRPCTVQSLGQWHNDAPLVHQRVNWGAAFGY